MTTNLHDKMLAAIDALFSASDAVEEEVAENLLLDVRDEILKQPAQQEPVAWMYQHPNNHLKTCYQAYKPNGECTPLYTTPQAQPAREWVGLDDTDLAVCDTDGVLVARYWERVLREKNT